MANKYKRATAVTTSNSTEYDPPFDALYIGGGNQTDLTVGSDIGTPTVWYRSGDAESIGAASWSDNLGDRDADLDGPASGVTDTAGTSDTNFKPWVTFDGSDSYLKADDYSGFQFDGEFEMMVVVRFTGGTGYQTIAAKDYDSSAWRWLMQSDGAGNEVQFAVGGDDPVGTASLSKDTWYILGVSRDSSDVMQLWLDGSTDGSSVTNNTDFSGDTGDFLLGSRWTGSAYTQEMYGDILEFIIWKGSSLSTAERSAAVTYLQDRFFNAQAAQVTLQNGASDIITHKDCLVGKVLEISSDRVKATNTNATDIVALYES